MRRLAHCFLLALPTLLTAQTLIRPQAPLPADFQRGMSEAHVHRQGHGYGSLAAKKHLQRLKGMGIRWVSLMPFGYQDGQMADRVVGFAGHEGGPGTFSHSDPTLRDAHLAVEIAAAHQVGMHVTLKPHIWSNDFWSGRQWAGTIDQSDAGFHELWWQSYRAFILHYARLAQQTHTEVFCIGTELVRMTAAPYEADWRALIKDVRKVYHGRLTYAAHWDTEFDRIPFWDALDFIGVTAYFPLDRPENVPVDELVSAWHAHRERIQALVQRVHKPVVFLEVGYRAVANGYQKPWEYSGGTPNLQAQERAYEAMFKAFCDAPWWKGIYIWKDFTDPDLADSDDGTDFRIAGRPAEAVIRKWFHQ